MLADYLDRWCLDVDGQIQQTPSSYLVPVIWQQRSAMLKIAKTQEEASAFELMSWWRGQGAAEVFIFDDRAIVLERAMGSRSLLSFCQAGHDAQATQIMCNVIDRLHQPKAVQPVGLTSLNDWFHDLSSATLTAGGLLQQAQKTAQQLLINPHNSSVLHGDIHHQNILDFGTRGWLAIDPKGLIGERAFDYANLFCNPDVVTVRDQFQKRLELIATLANIDRKRLLQWILAWSGLSIIWHQQDGTSADTAFAAASRAVSELGFAV